MIPNNKNSSDEEKPEKKVDWGKLKISPNIVSLVPYEAAKKYQFVPLEKDGRTLRVGVVDMDDIEVQNALQFLCGKKSVEH